MIRTTPQKEEPRPVFEAGRGENLINGLSDSECSFYHNFPVGQIFCKEPRQWILSDPPHIAT